MFWSRSSISRRRMMMDARAGRFDVLVAEGIDRLSRDQEHIAALYKQLRYLGIPIVTVAEGEISALHIGLKGTMSALFLKDLAQKTHRGLEGHIRDGKSAGGISYGYKIARKPLSDGTFTTDERTINEQEADVVRRIFRDYASGISPRAIAARLNAERIPGPACASWGASTIYGNWRRGTGILNNKLYIGRMIWNRQHFLKDPETGKRQAAPIQRRNGSSRRCRSFASSNNHFGMPSRNARASRAASCKRKTGRFAPSAHAAPAIFSPASSPAVAVAEPIRSLVASITAAPAPALRQSPHDPS